MNPKYRPLLFAIGAFFGGILALFVIYNFARLGGWTVAAILLSVWFGMGIVSLLLLRRQNRRR